MIEYLIRGSDEPGGGLGVHVTRLAAVLEPVGWSSEPVEGPGDFAILCAGALVSFSWEDPGWQVTFWDDAVVADEADRIVATIAGQLTASTGQVARIVRL